MPNITSTEAVTIGHDDLRLLGRVLAATDAAFIPLRAESGNTRGRRPWQLLATRPDATASPCRSPAGPRKENAGNV